jgi:starch synthase
MGAIERALTLYGEPLAWRRLQLKGMAEDFGWAASARRYAALYDQVVSHDYGAPGLPLRVKEKVSQIAG